MKTNKILRMNLLAFFIALEIIFTFVPWLGLIPIPPLNPTTLHIPVIVAALLLGPKDGAIVGLTFGLLTVIKATLQPDLSAFMFSPFVTFGGMSGNFNSLIIAIVPRVLIGITTGYSFIWLKKLNVNVNLAVIIAAVIGTMTNTILVLGGIYILFGHQYAEVFGLSYNLLPTLLMGVVATNGVGESIAAAVISWPVYKAGNYILKDSKK